LQWRTDEANSAIRQNRVSSTGCGLIHDEHLRSTVGGLQRRAQSGNPRPNYHDIRGPLSTCRKRKAKRSHGC